MQCLQRKRTAVLDSSFNFFGGLYFIRLAERCVEAD